MPLLCTCDWANALLWPLSYCALWHITALSVSSAVHCECIDFKNLFPAAEAKLNFALSFLAFINTVIPKFRIAHGSKLTLLTGQERKVFLERLTEPIIFKASVIGRIYQQKKTLRIPEVVDQQDFSSSSLLESLTQFLEVTQWKETARSRN